MGCFSCRSVSRSKRSGKADTVRTSLSTRAGATCSHTTCIESGTSLHAEGHGSRASLKLTRQDQHAAADEEPRSAEHPTRAVPVADDGNDTQQLKKKGWHTDQTTGQQQFSLPTDGSPKPISSGGCATTTRAAASLPASHNTTTDAVKPPDHRHLSMGRLKRSADIGETYAISQEVLGTGISGAVHVAHHKVTNRRYAIKTLSLEGVGPKKAAMLHNEVSIYLQLDHPNIAKLIEVYETNEAIHLVMELCTGGELYERLAMRKKYGERDAANVTKQMLSAINYCHKHHICHRDLKLENWVYADASPDAPLKLIDFGFSRIFNPGVPMTAMHGTVYYVSPEVMDGCYHEKCDIWSIGVIVYMLLSGSPPFNGSYDHEILVRIKRGSFSFSGPRWEGISDEAKSFIRFLLQKDPDARPSAERALGHPWLQTDETDDRGIDTTVLQSMRDFALGNVLRRAALGVVALSMTTHEVAELESVFRKCDRNNQGTLPLQDLVNVLIEQLHIDSAEAQRIFDKVDQTGKREVHYTEFIASTLQAKFVKDESLIREAFQRFDVHQRDLISLDDLRTVLGDSFNGTRVEEIMALCDTNKDNYIDFDEFRRALTSDEVVLLDVASNGEQQTTGNTQIERDDGSGERTSVNKREAALSALHSMRKATYLKTDDYDGELLATKT